MEKSYELPPITWLRVTDYLHDWLENELGGAIRAHGKRVISVIGLDGGKDVLKMETQEDGLAPGPMDYAVSVTRMNCIDAGMKLDASAVEHLYGATKEEIMLYVPVECPKMALTKNGVLRPWTRDITFGRQQALDMQRLLRNEFWSEVEKFNEQYSIRNEGEWYPAKEMITEFCRANKISDVHVDALRREWQRKMKKFRV